MFEFHETYKVHNEKGSTYAFVEEHTHNYTTSSAAVNDQMLEIARPFVRLLAKTPPLSEFSVSTEIARNPLWSVTAWEVVYGYNESAMTGYGVIITYYADRKHMKIDHMRISGTAHHTLSSVCFDNIQLDGNKHYPFSIEKVGNRCKGTANGCAFDFQTNAGCGRIAVARFGEAENAGEAIYGPFSICSADNLITETVHTNCYTIPCYDGGSEPYCIALAVKRYENPVYPLPNSLYQVSYTLTGGASSRPQCDYKMSIWSVQYDVFTNPYIRFLGKSLSEKLYLKNGELVFTEHNRNSNYIEALMGGQQVPYSGCFYLDSFEQTDFLCFGYDQFRRLGNEFQSDRTEFVFSCSKDAHSGLLYAGAPVSDDYRIRITSPRDKRITALIPKTVDEYDKALLHAQDNHYFMAGEEAAFTLHIATRYNDFISFRLCLTDTYFEELQVLPFTCVKEDDNISRQSGQCTWKLSANAGILAQGVYHIRADILLGSKRVFRHDSAFEIIDPKSSLSPRESAGLPFLYSGEGTPPNIRYNCPDPWIVKPDFSICHYIDCLLSQPEITESRRVWELLPLYKRKLFTWMDNRTIPTGKCSLDYPNTIKHSDYITADVPTSGGGEGRLITRPVIMRYQKNIEIYNRFKALHPEYADQLPVIDGTHPATNEAIGKIFSVCAKEWEQYFNASSAEYELQCLQEIRALNPDLRLSRYGVLGHYATSHCNAYWGKFRKNDLQQIHRILDGFAIYEDYPFITGTKPYNSAWGLMGYMLFTPHMEILPELFSNFDPVCPDSMVFYANPPMGAVKVPAYQVATQLYEYMFASCIFAEGAFRYYSNHKFQLLQSYNTQPKERFQYFLRSWGAYLKNKPANPLRSPAFVCAFSPEEDIYDLHIGPKHVNNRSLAGISYLYQNMAEAGIPRGFVTDWNGVLKLTPSLTDVVVIPSVKYAPAEVVEHLRWLNAQNVALIAVGDVTGLEDLFGVARDRRTVTPVGLACGEEVEYIIPQSDVLLYRSAGAETLLTLLCDGTNYPMVMKQNNCVLLNGYIGHIGMANTEHATQGGTNISTLLKRVCKAAAKSVSMPLANTSDMCALELLKNEQGDTMILLTDCTDYGTGHGKEVMVQFHDLSEKGIPNDLLVSGEIVAAEKDENAAPVNPLYRDGVLCGFCVELAEREARLFKIHSVK